MAEIVCVTGARVGGFNYMPWLVLWIYLCATHSHIIFNTVPCLFDLCAYAHNFRLHACISMHIRLRQESELLSRSSSQHWSQSDLQSYASTTNIANENDAAFVQSSDSLSSTETLKWLGSMSDISSSSHATNTSHISASGNYYHSSYQKHTQNLKQDNNEIKKHDLVTNDAISSSYFPCS